MENIVHMNGRWLRVVFLLSIFVFGLPLSSLAAKNITLAWSPSDDTNVVSYSVYYGTASRRYSWKMSLSTRKAVIPDLVENKTYFFAVTASNDLGMESALSSEVVYTVPPLPSGNYSGLFFEPDAIRQDRSGSFNVSVTGRFAYTGTLKVGSTRYSFSGKLDRQYRGTNFIRLRDGRTLTVAFNLGSGSRTGNITGSVSDGVWTAGLSADRGEFNSRHNPAPGRGNYTVIFASRAMRSPAVSQGYGFGTVKVSAGGIVQFAGSLADGTKVSQSALLSHNGHWPLYVSLYSGKGLVMSRIEFVNRSKSDLSGTLSWIKGADATARYYPEGFVDQPEVAGSACRTGSPFGFTEGTVAFSGGNLGAGFAGGIIVSPKSIQDSSAGAEVMMKVSESKGTFTGKTVDPATGKTWPFKGVVLQKVDTGYGYLVGSNQTSRVLITKRVLSMPD